MRHLYAHRHAHAHACARPQAPPAAAAPLTLRISTRSYGQKQRGCRQEQPSRARGAATLQAPAAHGPARGQMRCVARGWGGWGGGQLAGAAACGVQRDSRSCDSHVGHRLQAACRLRPDR